MKTMPSESELREQLEAAGLYDVLIYLHEQEHTDNCFCTTEISEAYNKLLSIIARSILEARIEEVRRLNKPELLEVEGIRLVIDRLHELHSAHNAIVEENGESIPS